MEKEIIEYFSDRRHEVYRGKEVVSILTELFRPKRKTLNVEFLSQYDIDELIKIIEAVEIVTGLDFDQFNVKSRKSEVVDARFLFIHFVHKRLRFKLSMIGRIMQGRDHSTIIHANKEVDNWLSNPKFYKRENNLINDIARHLERGSE